MSHYPKMLYRQARAATEATVDVNGSPFGTRIVADADEEQSATSAGWAEFAALSHPVEDGAEADTAASHESAATAVLRDELLEADKKLRAANERIATLETENAELKAKFAAMDANGDGKPGGSLPNDPPALTGKTKAELLKIAEGEGVTIEDGALNADIVTAIESKRAAGA